MLFTKAEWQALHTIFSYLFFILVIIHLFFINWRTFLTYFRSKIKAGLNKKWELGAAVILSGIIFLGTLRSWSPFGPVMVFGDKVREGWETKIEAPPVVHMEDYTLDKLSAVFDSIPSTDLLKTLSENHIKTKGTDISLETIARENHTTPATIYNLLADKYNKHKAAPEGGGQAGYGKYTLKSVSEKTGVAIPVQIERLREKGLDANEETSLKSIAERLGITPREAYELLTK